MIFNFAKILGIELPQNISDKLAKAQYRYDSLDIAKLKYLLNFVLSIEDRKRLIDLCFDEIFPDQELEISRDFYMDLSDLKKLNINGFAVGTHAHEHLPLGLLEDKEIESLINNSMIYLERFLGNRPFAMSYPYGSLEACSPRVGEIASNLGIEFAFTMERAGNRSLSNPLFLARFDTNDLPGGKFPKFRIENLFETVPLSKWYHNI